MSLDIVLLIIVVLLFIFASTSYMGLIIDLIKKKVKTMRRTMTIYDGYFNKNFINNRMRSRISNIMHNGILQY